MFRALFVLATLAAQAEAVVIDDFVDPAVVLNEEGEFVTFGVGDLAAERTLLSFEYLPDAPVGPEVADGQIRLTESGWIHYRFPKTDFSQYDSMILDVAQWPDPPADPRFESIVDLMVIAEVDDGLPLSYRVVFARPTGRIDPGPLVLPLDPFQQRGGGSFNWTGISQLWIQFLASQEFGPWKVAIDSISVGNAIPEPSSLACLTIGLIGWSLLYHSLRRTAALPRPPSAR